MITTYELNNVHKDSDLSDGRIKKTSPVVEVFSAMVQGKDLGSLKCDADKAVKYIKSLGEKASDGDPRAVSELNTIRRFVVEAPLMQEINLLSVFGTYTALGYDETPEREVYKHAGEKARMQANNGDVVFPTIVKETYPVPTFTVSAGYAVDYRRVALGDMTKENEGMEQVRVTIRNTAIAAIVEKIYNAIKAATGVKYFVEDAGVTKTNVDKLIGQIRRWGKPTILGDYAVLSQFTPFAGYTATVNTNTIFGISESVMQELAQTGMIHAYNGAILTEIPNPYDIYTMNEDGTDFQTVLPAGLAFAIPTGTQSPIATFTRGGLTSLTGNNVHNGKVETRFDLEVGADIAKGQEFKIGVLHDKNLDDLAD